MSKVANAATVPFQRFWRVMLVVMLALTVMRAAVGFWGGFDPDDAGSVIGGLAVAAIAISNLNGHRRTLWLVLGFCGVVAAWVTWFVARAS